jgi:phosphate/sulfate permease
MRMAVGLIESAYAILPFGKYLGIPSSLNFAVMGAVILIGVLADQLLKRKKVKA